MSPKNTSATKLEDIKALFHRAEERVKRVEASDKDSGVVVPAINELRYAGYHILEAETAYDQGAREEDLQKAKRHCQRAVYDAVEVAALDRLDRFDMFDQDYRFISFGEIVSDYTQKKRYVDQVRHFISETPREEREAYYEKVQEYLDKLDTIVNELDDARPEINKIMRRWRIGIILSVLGLGVGIVALAVTIALA